MPRLPSHWVALSCNVSYNAAVLCEINNGTYHNASKKNIGHGHNIRCPCGFIYIQWKCYKPQNLVKKVPNNTLYINQTNGCGHWQTADIFVLQSYEWFLFFFSKIFDLQCMLVRNNHTNLVLTLHTNRQIHGNDLQTWVVTPTTDLKCNTSTMLLCEAKPIISKVKCPRNSFMCSNGECILLLLVCDGKSHCSYGEDEVSCRDMCTRGSDCLMCKSPECFCTTYYYQCEEGGCLPLQKVCDGAHDCDSDEKHCDLTSIAPINSETRTHQSENCLSGHQYSTKPMKLPYSVDDACMYKLSDLGLLTPCSSWGSPEIL